MFTNLFQFSPYFCRKLQPRVHGSVHAVTFHVNSMSIFMCKFKSCWHCN